MGKYLKNLIKKRKRLRNLNVTLSVVVVLMKKDYQIEEDLVETGKVQLRLRVMAVLNIIQWKCCSVL